MSFWEVTDRLLALFIKIGSLSFAPQRHVEILLNKCITGGFSMWIQFHWLSIALISLKSPTKCHFNTHEINSSDQAWTIEAYISFNIIYLNTLTMEWMFILTGFEMIWFLQWPWLSLFYTKFTNALKLRESCSMLKVQTKTHLLSWRHKLCLHTCMSVFS